MTITAPERSVLLTRPVERQQAHDLLSVIDGHPARLAVTVASSAPISVPVELAQVLAKVLEAMADGGTVTIGSLPDELTTTVAAEQLGISRPTLMKMIRNGEISAHKVGAHHRLKATDVLAVKRARLVKQRDAFDELRRLDDELEGF